jgi:hypothetical protein
MGGLSRKTVCCAVVLAMAPLPLLAGLPAEYVDRPDYAFALAAIPGAAWCARRRLRQGGPYWAGHRRVGWFLVAFAGTALLAAAAFASPWTAGISLLLVLAALSWEFGGWAALRLVAPFLVIATLCLPLPLGWDGVLVASVGRASARLSGHVLDVLDVAHVRAGHVIVYAGGRMDFTSVLGGWFSPFALAVLILFLARSLRRGVVRTLLLTGAGLVFLPVTTAAVSAIKIAWVPDAVGAVGAAVAFVLAAGLALSVDQWAGIPAAIALRRHDLPSEAVPTIPIGPATWAGAVGPFAAAVFVGLAGLEVWALAAPGTRPLAAAVPGFPHEIDGWVTDGQADAASGMVAATYRKDRRRLEVTALPITGEVGPLADLESAGWIVSRDGVSDDLEPFVVRFDCELPAEKFATVWLCGFTGEGRKVMPAVPLSGPVARLRSAVARAVHADPAPTCQYVRVMLVTTIPPGVEDLEVSAAAARQVIAEFAERPKQGDGQ